LLYFFVNTLNKVYPVNTHMKTVFGILFALITTLACFDAGGDTETGSTSEEELSKVEY